jgi:hypothetical protein
MRVNCLDCLDRTNYIMCRVGWYVMDRQFKMLGMEQLEMNFFGSELTHSFLKMFKNLWADNADYLSKQYTGTASTISDVTRNGK